MAHALSCELLEGNGLFARDLSSSKASVSASRSGSKAKAATYVMESMVLSLHMTGTRAPQAKLVAEVIALSRKT